MARIDRLRLLVFVCVALFALGLFGPSLTIVPQFGELTRVVKLLRPSFDSPQELSIMGGIRVLFAEREWLIGLIVTLFSVVFPLWKLGVLWGSVEQLRRGFAPSKELRFIERLGKFSMLDVYVMAVLLISMKGLPGGTEVHLRWGLLAFALSVLLTLKIPAWIEEESGRNTSDEAAR